MERKDKTGVSTKEYEDFVHLSNETVWLEQRHFEDRETLFHMSRVENQSELLTDDEESQSESEDDGEIVSQSESELEDDNEIANPSESEEDEEKKSTKEEDDNEIANPSESEEDEEKKSTKERYRHFLNETVWLKQKYHEDKETLFHMRRIVKQSRLQEDREKKFAKKTKVCMGPLALMRETIWHAQARHEDMEADYQRRLVGVPPIHKIETKMPVIPGMPVMFGMPVMPVKPPVKQKVPGPPPLSYEERLEDVLSELKFRHLVLTGHMKDLLKFRQVRIMHMHYSIINLSQVVQQCLKRMGLNISECDEHIASCQGLLKSFETTLEMALEKNKEIKAAKENNNTELKGSFSQKSLFHQVKGMENEFKTWFEETNKLKMGTLGNVPDIVKSIKNLSFVENVENMNNKFTNNKYTKMRGTLQKIQETLTPKKTDSLVNESQGANNDVKVNNRVTTTPQINNNTKIVNIDATARNMNVTVRNDSKMNANVTKKERNRKKTGPKFSRFSDFDSNESRDGSLDVSSRNRSHSKENKTKVYHVNKMANQGNKARLNQGTKKTTPSPQPDLLRDESRKSTNITNTKYGAQSLGQGAQSGWGHYSMRNDASVSGGAVAKTNSVSYNSMSNQSTQNVENYNHHNQNAKWQLKDIAYKIRQICVISGPTIQLQEMLAEAELLLQMIQYNIMQDQFPHRYALLMTAFNYHLAVHKKDGGLVLDSPPDQSNSTNSNLRGLENPNKKDQAMRYNPGFNEKSENPTPAVMPVAKKKVFPCASSTVHKAAVLNPCGPRDNHRAGISSIVVLDELDLLILVDIINSCLKLYDLNKIYEGRAGSFMTTLQIPQPYYMTPFGDDKVVVSKADKILTVVEVSNGKKPLELSEHIKCRNQYYGVGWVRDNIIAGACYEGNVIDLVRVKRGHIEFISTLRSDCYGPELLSVVPLVGNIVYLERVRGQGMYLTCSNIDGTKLFHESLGGRESDVWNLACVEEKIICCNKRTNKIVLYSRTGRLISSLLMPLGAVRMPFAIGCSKHGHLFVANDAAWEEDNNHYVTTEINLFTFTNSCRKPKSHFFFG